MNVGSKWGWLTCIEVIGGWAEDGGGAVREWIKEKEYRLGCGCGREITTPAADFPGKRAMRACGQVGCAAGKAQGTAVLAASMDGDGRVASMGTLRAKLGRPRKSEERSGPCAFYLPYSVRDWLHEQGAARRMSASAIVIEAVRAAMQTVEEQNGKA